MSHVGVAETSLDRPIHVDTQKHIYSMPYPF